MDAHERILLTLNHKEPDRVPYDMGGTVVTGIQAKAYSRLRKYLGLPEKEIVIIDILQQLAQVDEDVMERMGLDCKNISLRSTASFKIDLKLTPDRRYSYSYDEYQVGWRMPVDGGMYYDMFHHPLSGNIIEEDVDRYALPDPLDPSRFDGLPEAARKVLDEEKRTHVVLDFTKVKYLSSQAIGIILTLNKKLTGGSAGGEGLVLCGVGPQLMQLLKITRLDRILTIKSSQQDAVAK